MAQRRLTLRHDAGPSLRAPAAPPHARLRRRDDPHAGAWHRRQHGGVQCDERGCVAVAAGRRSRPARVPSHHRSAVEVLADRIRRHLADPPDLRAASSRVADLLGPDRVRPARHQPHRDPPRLRSRNGVGRHGQRQSRRSSTSRSRTSASSPGSRRSSACSRWSSSRPVSTGRWPTGSADGPPRSAYEWRSAPNGVRSSGW